MKDGIRIGEFTETVLYYSEFLTPDEKEALMFGEILNTDLCENDDSEESH